MKKTLLAIFFLATSLFGFAESKTYTDDLVVTVNEASSPAQKSDIQVEFMDNNKCNLSLQNFCLGSGEDVIYVGNITLNDITLTEAGDYKTFEVEETINITAGNLPDVAEGDWFGPYLGNVPIKMTGKINDDKLYCLIDIDMMASLKQIIKVTFGSDFNNTSNIKTYSDNLAVTINDKKAQTETTDMSVEFLNNNTCNISLPNFYTKSEDGTVYLGNINVNDIELIQEDGYQTFNVERTINITPGNLPDVGSSYWFGPFLGNVPIKMTGKINDDKLYCQIDIDLTSSLAQTIKATFGSDFADASNTKTYVDDLIVTINDQSSPTQKSEIKVVFNDNNTCNISLENFCLGSGEDVIYVGNINVDNVELTQEDGYQTFNVERIINIKAGNLPDVAEGDWFGPYLGDVPIKMTGKINDDKLYCLIDIDMMASLKQIIKVTFGSDITTSVSTVTSNRNGKTNVYTINGVCVAKDVDTIHALDNLKNGVYIVNGQKVIKK